MVTKVKSNHGHKFNPKKAQMLERKERFDEEPFDELAPIMQLDRVKTIVDLGCGSGFYTYLLAKNSKSDTILWALDLSQDLLDRLRENFLTNVFGPNSGKLLEKIRTRAIQENFFPIETETVDLFLSTRVLHEMSDYEAFLGELGRVMKFGGIVVTLDFQKAPTKSGPPLDHRVSLAEAEAIFSREPFEVAESGPIFQQFYFIKAVKK